MVNYSAFSREYSYSPTDVGELTKTLKNKLKAGDIVYLEDGIYNDFQVVFTGCGTDAEPIMLKARNAGGAVLTGKLNIRLSGSYLMLDGLMLKDGMALKTDIIEFRTSSKKFAYNCRLTNSVIDNCNNPDPRFRESTKLSERWVMLYGKNNRIDHCYFTNKVNGGVLIMANLSAEESRENNHRIDHNFFSSRPNFKPENNAEIIRLGDSHTSQYSSNSLVENNYFYACDGEVEIISVKSCDNIFRNNVFYESQGALVCRHGHRNIVESNAFIGNGKQNTAGVRIINQGHRIYNNFFQDLVGEGSYSALCVMTAIFESPDESINIDHEPLNAYHAVKDVEICHNTFINCQNIDLGTNTVYNYSKNNPIFPEKKIYGTIPPNCLIANNIIYSSSRNNVLNLINGNVDDVKFANNVYKLNKRLKLDGFEARKINYTKIKRGDGKGIYVMINSDINLLGAFDVTEKDFDYVNFDISGALRSIPKSVGAQQTSTINHPFAVAKLSEVGVLWYKAIDLDKEKISRKTDFWENR